ncbi:MAG: hypothetical protein ACK4HB_02450 [Candidatus Bipolaricaulia bacterium]
MAAERRWVFLVTVLIFLIGSTIYALRQPLEFETGALVRVKAPPLPAEFSVRFHWGADFWRSPDLAVQVAKKIRISDEPGDTWPVVSWLSKNLEISEAEDLVTLTLRGGFTQRTVRDALAEYIEQASEKLKGDLRSSIESESRRLSALQKALGDYRQQLIQALTAQLEERKALLQAQKEGIEKKLQELLKSRQMRVSEQGATLESWYYRTYLESLLQRLEEVERELDLEGTQGVRALEGYQRVQELEERMESLSQAQVEARQILETWEPVELVTPAQLPQGPVGPDRARTILWGVGIGVVVGFLLAIFSPRQRVTSD